MIGPVAFALAELPETGSQGTSLEDACEQEHWGIVLKGEVSLAAGRRSESFQAGTAFYVRPGKPAHRFRGDGPSAIAGFVPVPPDLDVTEDSLRGQGFEIVRRPPAPPSLPSMIRLGGAKHYTSSPGDVAVELAVMGAWVCSRTIFGSSSGYASDWCDLPHWGVVLSGNVGIHWENDLELLSAGDVYYVPGGPPGHRLEAPDGATTLDYTPVADIGSVERQADWRRIAFRTVVREVAAASPRARIQRRSRHDCRAIRPSPRPVSVPV